MSLVVITGAVRSGKSSAGERLAAGRGKPVVVAAAGREDDDEMRRRIAAHRASRPVGFEVREVDGDSAWIADVPPNAVLVVECLGTIVGRMVGEARLDGETADAAHERALAGRVDALVAALCARKGDTVVVTNEVGWGVVPAFASGRVFRDLVGRANRGLVESADAAYLAVDGRFVDLKTLPAEPPWPVRDGEDEGR